LEVLAAVDFFTTEVWMARGLTTYYVLSFVRVAWLAGITSWPDQRWMAQMARNVAMETEGLLGGCRYLLHDRDAKFCAAFDAILEAVGPRPMKLPPRSPNLNAHLERCQRSLKLTHPGSK
jgi:hypothetical protein